MYDVLEAHSIGGLMDRNSAHCKLTLGALVFALPLALGDLQAADNSAPQQAPTFTKDVAPILYANCARCHQPGEIAPMSLLTYAQTSQWAKSINERVVKRTMPPLLRDKTTGIQHYKTVPSLSDAHVGTHDNLLDDGRPQGNRG